MTSAPAFTPLAALGHYTERSDDEVRVRAREFLEQARRRHTVREFAPDPVPREAIEDCIRAAGLAPSGANHQPWRFVLIGDAAMKRRLREAAEAEERAFYSGKAPSEWIEALAPLGTDAEKPYLETAPWLIAVFAQRRGGPNPGDDLKNYYINESVGIAVGFLILALHHAGLVALTHTPNPMGFLVEALARADHEKPYMIIVVGRPAADARVPDHALKKKPLDEILTIV
jgi:nitroreductase